MATLAIRQGIWTSLSQRNRTAVQMMDDLALGEGVLYTDGVDQWMIFDDDRWTQEHIAYLACFLSNVGQLRASYAIPMRAPSVDPDGTVTPPTQIDREALKDDMRIFCDLLPGQGFVHPDNVPHVEFGNRWQELIDAQGGTHSRMASGVPDGWTPVEVI